MHHCEVFFFFCESTRDDCLLVTGFHHIIRRCLCAECFVRGDEEGHVGGKEYYRLCLPVSLY